MRRLVPLIMAVLWLGSAGASAQEADSLDPARTAGPVKKVLYRVQLLRSRGEADKARFTIREHLRDHPDQDHALLQFHLGQVLAQADSMGASAAAFERAVELEPDLAPAWRNLGEVAYGLGHFGRAADAFGQAFALDPEDPAEIRYYQGVALLQAGRAEESFDVLADLVERPGAPPELAWYRALLSAAVEAGRIDRVTDEIEDMTAAFPEDEEAWYLAYQQAATAQDYPRAARNLTVVGYLRGLTPEERIQLGDLCQAAGAPVRAARHFTAVADSVGGPAAPELLDRLVSAWLAADRPVEALAVLDQRLARNPSVRFWRLKGELLYGQGEFAEANRAFGEATALDPDDAELLLLQGYCLLELGRSSEATRMLNLAARDPRYESRAREALVFLGSREE